MRTDFSEAPGVQPLLASFINRLLAKSERGEGLGLVSESTGFLEEDIKQKAREVMQVTQAMQVTINMPSSTWGSAVNFLSMTAENISLRKEVEQIKQQLAELEERMPKKKVIVLREISREQAKQEIQQLFSSGRTLYYSDIAEELSLDLELVVDICRELEENREVRVDKSAL
jgi:regulator of replication initiation timing